MEGIADPGLVAEPIDVFGFEPEPTEQSALDEISPGRGTFFDERIDMLAPGGAALTAKVLEILADGIPRQRKRRQDAQDDHEIRTRKLIANGLRCHFYRDPPRTSYFRRADSYPDKPRWMRGQQLANAVDDMEAMRLLAALDSKQSPNKDRAYSSSYIVSPALLRLADECGVTATSIKRQEPPERLVRLYQRKGPRKFDYDRGRLAKSQKGEQVQFPPTPEPQDWTERLAAINAFYDRQVIDIGLTGEQLQIWLDKFNNDEDRRGAPYRLPERIQTDLCRIFNNGDPNEPRFDQGGRLAGGWWLSVPKCLRKCITINGQPTLELDYSACHPRMLYHEAGKDYLKDAYILPEIEAYERRTGVEPETYRGCIKWQMQVLINCRGKPERADKPDDVEVPPDIPLAEIVAMIEAEHQPIASAFKTGAGMRLMKRESDIALKIVETAASQEWTILPIHDSFITTIDRHRELYYLMKETYYEELNHYPIIR